MCKFKEFNSGFNPYCAGCSFGRLLNYFLFLAGILVSILIVLDVVLEDNRRKIELNAEKSFNPYCAGCSFGSGLNQILSYVLNCFNPYCAGCSFGR